MRVRSRAGLPSGPWRGRAVLVYQRAAWFSGGDEPMVGLLSAGMGPALGGLELDGPLPLVRPGARLESDGTNWFLEGTGFLQDGEGTIDAPVALGFASVDPPPGWKSRWKSWFGDGLGRTEGRWLVGLIDGPSSWDTLVGRGPGSTPAGDDYLAGWFAARWQRGLFGEGDRRRLLRSLAGTTRLSRHYLWHLADGRVDPALLDFLGARPLPEPGSEPAERLAAHGDLSGRATLVGLVAGLTSGE